MVNMKVAIVEDYRMTADLLALVCRTELKVDVVINETHGRPALEQIRKLKPDLVLLDLALPDIDGLAIADLILRELPVTKILVLSALRDPVALNSVRKLGIHGFIDKRHQTVEMLKNAIQAVKRGDSFFAPVINEAAAQQRSDTKCFTRILSNYEQHILSLIGESKSDEEIASVVGISPVTVQSRRRDIMNKLDIHSTPKLIRYAMEKGFTRAEYFPRESRYGNGEVVRSL